MKQILSATLFTAALLCAIAFAQSTPSQTPGAPPQQPEAQPAQATQPPTSTPTGASPSAQDPGAPPEQPETQPNTRPSQATQAPASAPSATTREQTTSNRKIAPGSVIPVSLTKTIDAKKAKPGDEVVAKVTMDLKSNSGEVIVPKDTKVVGHVTEAQARSKDQKESQVGIAFDRATLNGIDMSLPMSIQAVIAPPSNNTNSSGGSPDQGAPPTGGNSAPSPMASGRSGSAPSQTASPSPTPSAAPTENAQQSSARAPITGNTQGVVGISNLKLEPAPSAAQGSVLSSEKNNVKVESGTMLLLKVNQ